MKKPSTNKPALLQEVPLVDDKDIFSVLVEKKGTSLFLGRYSMNEVFAVLRKKNFFKEAQKKKLWPLDFDLDSSEFPVQRFQIFFKKRNPENLVVDLKIRGGTFRHENRPVSGLSFPESNFLIIEWLTLQNPLLSFSEEKAALPGQKHPGLNLGKKVLDIFVYLARITRKDGLLGFPAYFHNALLFSRSFHFINPEKQGEILAIRRAFRDITFKELAWIVHLNCLRRGNGNIYEWEAQEQVVPLNKGLKKYFDSKIYKEEVKESQKMLRFSIDWECYRTKLRAQNLKIIN